MITIAHILLAMLLFMLVNWIGKHSIASGYHQLSLFAKADEAPAFTLLFRVLAPTVFLVLSASLFYALQLEEFVVGYYRVAIYYVVFRWLFNLLLGRALLLNSWTPASLLLCLPTTSGYRQMSSSALLHCGFETLQSDRQRRRSARAAVLPNNGCCGQPGVLL